MKAFWNMIAYLIVYLEVRPGGPAGRRLIPSIPIDAKFPLRVDLIKRKTRISLLFFFPVFKPEIRQHPGFADFLGFGIGGNLGFILVFDLDHPADRDVRADPDGRRAVPARLQLGLVNGLADPADDLGAGIGLALDGDILRG